MTSLEGLHPDLVPCIRHGHHFFGTMIEHPLLILRNVGDVLPPGWGDEKVTSWAEYANSAFAFKRDAIERALETKDWGVYVFTHERAYRFDALNALITNGHATIDDLWPVIGHAWSDSENIHQSTFEWLDLWRKPSRRKRMAMNRADRDTWKALPAKLTIYRGVNCDDEFDAEDAALTGLSWTLSRKKAIWFARRGSSQPYVAKGTIFKRHCFAYFSDRNEQEIVVDPDWTSFSLMKVRRARR